MHCNVCDVNIHKSHWERHQRLNRHLKLDFEKNLKEQGYTMHEIKLPDIDNIEDVCNRLTVVINIIKSSKCKTVFYTENNGFSLVCFFNLLLKSSRHPIYNKLDYIKLQEYTNKNKNKFKKYFERDKFGYYIVYNGSRVDYKMPQCNFDFDEIRNILKIKQHDTQCCICYNDDKFDIKFCSHSCDSGCSAKVCGDCFDKFTDPLCPVCRC
jgi:hypothetical protein